MTVNESTTDTIIICIRDCDLKYNGRLLHGISGGDTNQLHTKDIQISITIVTAMDPDVELKLLTVVPTES